MKKIKLFLIIGLLPFVSKAQLNYLSDVITKADIRNNVGYLAIGINYWRYDTCLDSKQMCKYNHSTAFDVKVKSLNDNIFCELLRGNNSGYQSKNPYDTFGYIFSPQNLNTSNLIRRLLIKDKYVKADTFNLTAIDTLLYKNYSLIRKVFGQSQALNHRTLKIYVLRSVDEFGSVMLHYWVERIGIIKLTDEKCWRYSFEMKDDRTQSIKKMVTGIMNVVKQKYKDPYWLSEPCGFEQ